MWQAGQRREEAVAGSRQNEPRGGRGLKETSRRGKNQTMDGKVSFGRRHGESVQLWHIRVQASNTIHTGALTDIA